MMIAIMQSLYQDCDAGGAAAEIGGAPMRWNDASDFRYTILTHLLCPNRNMRLLYPSRKEIK